MSSNRPVDESIAYRGQTSTLRHYLTTDSWAVTADVNSWGPSNRTTRAEAIARWRKSIDVEIDRDALASFAEVWRSEALSDLFVCPRCSALVEDNGRLPHHNWHEQLSQG